MPVQKERRRKKISDYPWIKVHWADLFMNTSGMTDSEFRNMFVDGYKAWVKNDIETMPAFIRSIAETIHSDNESRIKEREVRKGTEHDVTCCNNTTGDVTVISSPLLSSPSCINIKEGSAEGSHWNTRFHEFLSAGPSCWLNWEQMAFDAWKYLRNTDPIASADDIIASAIAFRAVQERDKTESRYITRPHNFLASGAYKTDWSNVGKKTEETNERVNAYKNIKTISVEL